MIARQWATSSNKIKFVQHAIVTASGINAKNTSMYNVHLARTNNVQKLEKKSLQTCQKRI